MTTREIRIDRGRPLTDQTETGHNRWHPDIPPILECAPGDEVVLETRDALDGQLTPESTVAQVGQVDLGVVHPLTGPVFVAGAQPGDLLEVEILEVAPEPFGFTAQIPGFGFLADVFDEPHLVRWRIEKDFATSGDLPGVRVPAAPFMGTIGLTPGHELLRRTRDREQAALDAGGAVLPPDPAGAVPATGSIAAEALRTIPPREQGGNVDIKHLVAGTRLFLPVDTPGALFSAGDAHFAQGDCEACGTAIEMAATLRVRFAIHSGMAAARGIQGPRFSREGSPSAAPTAEPARYIATTGMPLTESGENRPGDLSLAARNALLAMIDELRERGFSRPQAYALCSVAVDLKVSQVVDVPNVLVSAFLPLDIFDSV
ncbi:MAG TPA: acetamidase/formamidase family protein [Trebonia sp.]|jgi:formamidase